MKLSVSVTNYSWTDRIHTRLASLAGFLDGTAVDTLWVPDHLLQPIPPAGPTKRTVTTALEDGGNSEEVADRCRALSRFGVQHVVGSPVTGR
ncbi:MAG: hypothetical protein QOF67_1407 [Mycobacterium sp.]|jgi:hypothetical protein|nr:hypothetical protein [Mycobacterium sp.]